MKTQTKITGDANQVQNLTYLLKGFTLDSYENAGNNEFVLTLEHPDEIELKNKLLDAKSVDEINQIDLEITGEINKFTVSEDTTQFAGWNLTINGVEINDTVFDEEKVDYIWKNRVDLIKDIQQWLGEARQMGRDSDAQLMDNDIDYLKTLTDDYVFSSISTNEHVAASKNPRQFNDICHEILSVNSQLKCSSEQTQQQYLDNQGDNAPTTEEALEIIDEHSKEEENKLSQKSGLKL